MGKIGKALIFPIAWAPDRQIRVFTAMPSSVIRRIDYDAAQRRLDILFVTGRRYAYHEVPREEFDAFRAAFSKGEYFNAHIRDRYRFTQYR